MSNLTVEKNRLIDTIHATAQWGAKGVWGPRLTDTGVCRLALSDLDKQVREWFIAETKALGCTVKVDEVGNIFATYPGRKAGPPTAIGSHLDTQPTGGRYDGIYGVLLGLEVLRTLKDNNYVPNFPICVIDWTNEEGARFPMSIMASSVWSEQIPKQTVYDLQSVTDAEPVSVLHELERIGFKGDVPALYRENPIAAHFEIHIEQGPVLENEHKEIGIVTGVQAYAWYKVKVTGKPTHTGTTPFSARSDALLAAARMITRGHDIAQEHGGLFSVGVFGLEPGVVNVIPGDVSFTVDARHVEDAKLADIVRQVHEDFAAIANTLGTKISVEFDHIYTSPAVKFHDDCIKCVTDSAVELFGEDKVRRIVSGAGHDSCATSSRVPTSMIFIPSKDGVSHNPEEYSTPEQVANGFEVLLSAVLKYDNMRKK